MELKKNNQELIKEINFWRQKRQAIILAHNYQVPEIQDLADFVGDSLELSQKAAETENRLIVFCGVHFMAETAAILSPNKTVLIPDPNAGCSLANSITVAELRRWKKKYPNALVVLYVNSSAAIKAESDFCCTSTNAVKIVNSIPKDKPILFVPDMFLGDYVAKMTGRDNIIVYTGECHVHARVRPVDILNKLKEYPQAEFLIHPECGCVSNCLSYVASGDLPAEKTHIFSTGNMIKYCRTATAKQFVVATETGIIHRLQKDSPGKKFIPVRDGMICQYMKMITLEKVLHSLKNLEFEVKVPQKIAEKARIPIQRMLELSQ